MAANSFPNTMLYKHLQNLHDIFSLKNEGMKLVHVNSEHLAMEMQQVKGMVNPK